MAKKIKGLPVYMESENGNYAVCYSQWDMGNKFPLYHKTVSLSDGHEAWKYVNSFETSYKAWQYFQNALDCPLFI